MTRATPRKAARRPGGRVRRMGRPPADYSARDQILRGAAEVFGRLGYARAAVEEILVAADVSRRTFYRVFRNKDDVFSALFDRAVERVLAFVRDAVAHAATPAEKLQAGLEAYLGAQLAIGPLARVLLLEQFPPGSTFGRRREAAVEAFIALVEQELRGLRRARVDPLLVRGVVAAIDYVAVELVGQARPGAFDAARGQRVMSRILAVAFAEPGDALPPLPVVVDAE